MKTRPAASRKPPGSRAALHVVILSSGEAYQKAASRAAGTFSINLSDNASVTVLVPQTEERLEPLASMSQTFGFKVASFPFVPGRSDNFIALLKCQAFVWTLKRSNPNEIVLFADADTTCLAPFSIVGNLRKQIGRGMVGFAPDICDRHFKNTDSPWYLNPSERLVYVNSGVFIASLASLPFFSLVLNLAQGANHFIGPMQDQTLINFALGRHFPELLITLPKTLNAINCDNPDTVISHFAGGAGFLGQQPRFNEHRDFCEQILSTPSEKLSG